MSNNHDPILHLITDRVARELGETDERPRKAIYRIAQECGASFMERMVARAKEIESNGGMLTLDGTRRRTLGGIFFNVTLNYILSKRYRTHAWRKRSEALSDVFPELHPNYREIQAALTKGQNGHNPQSILQQQSRPR